MFHWELYLKSQAKACTYHLGFTTGGIINVHILSGLLFQHQEINSEKIEQEFIIETSRGKRKKNTDFLTA